MVKNEITSLTRLRKKEYYHKYFTENKANLQKIWKGIKEVINIKSKTFNHPTCIKSGNTTIHEPIKVANSFNNYFSNIAEDILKKRKYNGNTNHRSYLKNPLDKTFAAFECDEQEIQCLISTLNQRKGIGPNSIPTKLLIMLKNEISLPLSILFNISLNTGTFPNVLKLSETIPVYKKGSR